MDSAGPKEACIRWGPDTHAKGQLLGVNGMPDNTVSWAVQKWQNKSICHLVVDLGGPKEA